MNYLHLYLCICVFGVYLLLCLGLVLYVSVTGCVDICIFISRILHLLTCTFTYTPVIKTPNIGYRALVYHFLLNCIVVHLDLVDLTIYCWLNVQWFLLLFFSICCFVNSTLTVWMYINFLSNVSVCCVVVFHLVPVFVWLRFLYVTCMFFLQCAQHDLSFLITSYFPLLLCLRIFQWIRWVV